MYNKDRMIVSEDGKIIASLSDILKLIENHSIKLIKIPTGAITIDQLNELSNFTDEIIVKRKLITIPNPTKDLINYLNSNNIKYTIERR